MISFQAHSQSYACSLGLDQVLAEASASGKYAAPAPADLQQGRSLFAATLRGDRSRRLHADWQKLGFRFYKVGSLDVWALYQTKNQGAGCYFFRKGQSQPWALQVPDGVDRRHTGNIGLQWVNQGNWHAAAINTSPRGQADLAHVDNSWFQTFTQAWLDVFPEGSLVQVHGFARNKRTEVVARRAAMIVSNGTPHPGQRLRNFREALASLGLGPVLSFGKDTQELGGETNRQGVIVRQRGGRFYHLELSEIVRARLVADSDLCQRMLVALDKGLRE